VRNVQKKESEKELAMWQKKAGEQAAEIRRLKSEAGRTQQGLAQWGRIVDATLTQLALSHGAQVGVAAWEIVLPTVSVFENGRDYKVTTAVAPDEKNYIIRVEKRA
jgi:hypothetical protein